MKKLLCLTSVGVLLAVLTAWAIKCNQSEH